MSGVQASLAARGRALALWCRAGLLGVTAGVVVVSGQSALGGEALLVHLADIDPSIEQDIRYAGPDNFTGAPVPGYQAAECMLLRPVAQALAAVQRDLRRDGYALKVYDCYRPERAVRAFARWAETGGDGAASKRFHPRLARSALFGAGYIARRSGHSRGAAVDLTLVRSGAAKPPAFEANRLYGDCTAPAGERAPDSSIDMGTGFDCFDARSHLSSGGLTAEQTANRQRLQTAMRRHGFRGYQREWWHFTHGASDDAPALDVPITARRGAGR